MQSGSQRQKYVELNGAVVIITGGGTGIGRATAMLFAERGARVVVCGRRSEPLTETVQLITQRAGIALAVPTDVRNWAQVRGMLNTVLERFGKVDVLVNNAGVSIAKPIEKTSEEEWNAMLDTNLKGIFLCCKAVLPSMVQAGDGVIVNVSSVLGKTGIANFGAYCASKFGAIGLTQSLADELKPRGIRVYAVCPGSTYTDLHRRNVGEEIAKVAMLPERIAAEIMGLVKGKISLESGSAIVIDEQSLRPISHEGNGAWQKVAVQWLKPAFRILHRLRNLTR